MRSCLFLLLYGDNELLYESLGESLIRLRVQVTSRKMPLPFHIYVLFSRLEQVCFHMEENITNITHGPHTVCIMNEIFIQ